MGILKEKRMAAIRNIMASFWEIDRWNLNPENKVKKQIDEHKFILEIMARFDVGMITAKDYYNAAKTSHEMTQRDSDRQEIRQYKNVGLSLTNEENGLLQ